MPHNSHFPFISANWLPLDFSFIPWYIMPCQHECDKTESDFSRVVPINYKGPCLFPYLNGNQCYSKNTRLKIQETNVLKPNKLCFDVNESNPNVLVSNTDAEMLIYIYFTKIVRLRGLCLVSLDESIRRTYRVEQPSKINLYVNRDDISFDRCATIKPTESIDLKNMSPNDTFCPVKPTLFFRTSSLTIHIPGNRSQSPEIKTALQHIGFFGEASEIEVSKRVVTTVYETKPSVHDYGSIAADLIANQSLC